MSQAQGLPASISRPATVDCQSLSVDVAALSRVSQKRNRACNIVRRSEPPHGHSADNICIRVASSSLIDYIHFGLYPTRTNRIHTNTAASPFRGKGSRLTNEPVF
jgi:hypothetical protein